MISHVISCRDPRAIRRNLAESASLPRPDPSAMFAATDVAARRKLAGETEPFVDGEVLRSPINLQRQGVRLLPHTKPAIIAHYEGLADLSVFVHTDCGDAVLNYEHVCFAASIIPGPRPTSHVPCPTSHVPCPKSHVPCPTSHVPCPTSRRRCWQSPRLAPSPPNPATATATSPRSSHRPVRACGSLPTRWVRFATSWSTRADSLS